MTTNSLSKLKLSELQAQAAEQVSRYPQYAGHEQQYVLGYCKKTISTKSRVAFTAGEIILVRPQNTIERFTDHFGKPRATVVAWSMSNQIATVINASDVIWI